MKIRAIKYISDIQKANPENDNIDVHVELEDGRVFSVLAATPNNIVWCMDNEGVEYYFGTPAVYVKRLTDSQIRSALAALVDENNGYWLEVYGIQQD